MVILGTWKGQALTISEKSSCLTISLQTSAQSQVFSFDYEGRLWTAMSGGVSYRRGLDGKTIAKWIDLSGEHQRQILSESDALALEELARQTASDLAQDLLKNKIKLDTDMPISVVGGLTAASRYDSFRRKADLAQYAQVYKPVGILPPDQYFAVVLQAAEGCSFNSCTFCNFYKDRPFRIKSLLEFQAHIQQVKQFLGKGLSLRRTIFLGDANALVIPTKRLLPMLDEINQNFNVEELGGIYAFLDGFSADKKSSADYHELASRGIKRIYIGMESGNAELLSFLRKPGKPEDAIEAVRSIKAAGISVGLIFLLGAGGHQFARQHVQDTITAINSLPLDLDDVIYFSELVTSDQLAYVQSAYQESLLPLSAEERLEQQRIIESNLLFSPEAGIPHISRYDIREFVY